MFITFEGIEGCGKTTQAKKLKHYLEEQNKEVVLTREPGGSKLGIELRKILLSLENQGISKECELFLYLADRVEHVQQVIKPALAQGKVVISDRYVDSTLVYQGYGRGIELDLLYQLNALATNNLEPNITILLDLPVETGLKRALERNLENKQSRQEGRFEAESLDFHQKIREGYLTLASLHPERFIVLDGSPAPEKVFAQLLEKIKNKLKF
ncbi:MAG: dTMP kinase [Desulfonauticus sp.]|jgi:dTMP kinase|nr:MAG: Thymidylate kinase [Desulfonauticus sp. 38_4375]MDK2921870.1 dTMP kinase [Desulfonauticus sp.]